MTTETDGTPDAPVEQQAQDGPDARDAAPEAEHGEDRSDETAVDDAVVGDAEVEPVTDETSDDAEEADETAAHETAADDTVADEDGVSASAATPAGEPVAKSSRKVALEAEGDVAADFLEALLDICDIDGDIDVDIDGDRAAVSIVDSDEGRVPRRLVGPDGKVLEALQELTRLAVQTETGERSRLMLDVAGHRAARRAEIVEIARGVVDDVKNSGDQIEMEPMTAFERKIVHDEVLAAGLRSESDGVEPRRFVVVLPAS